MSHCCTASFLDGLLVCRICGSRINGETGFCECSKRFAWKPCNEINNPESFQCVCGFACNVWNRASTDILKEIKCSCGKIMKKVDNLESFETDESDKLRKEQDEINIKHFGDKHGQPSLEMLNYKLNLIMNKLGIEY